MAGAMRKYGPGFTTEGAAKRISAEKAAASKASVKRERLDNLDRQVKRVSIRGK